MKEGQPTQSVGDQEEIKKLFPNTYGMPIVEFEPATEANTKKMDVGIILYIIETRRACIGRLLWLHALIAIT